MDPRMEDLLHCEDQLKTTLHCNDKEKLRRKLAQLQREYFRTAQRLKRAEHLETVRKHVRSRISQQLQKDPDQSCDPLSENPNVSATNEPQSHMSTKDVDCVTQEGHRPSPSLRLRSRRSRLRWERKSAEEGQSITDTGKREELGETAGKGEEEEDVKSEELFSGSESESPSLLLTHWSSQGHGARGNGHCKENGANESEKEADMTTEGEKESTSLLIKCVSPHRTTKKTHDCGTGSGGEECLKQTDGVNVKDLVMCENNSHAENHIAEQIEDKHPRKKEGITKDPKDVGILDSCTLVEGLPFPVEYYIRTTRRMSSSLSQPDMQAVVLSQLSGGRQRRSRGRGLSRSIRDKLNDSCDQSQRCGEISDCSLALKNNSDAAFSSSVGTPRPSRGQRGKGRRGRGRPASRRSASHQPLSFEESMSSVSPVVTGPALVDAELPLNQNDNPQISPGSTETPSSSDSKQPKKIYSIFRNASSQRSTDARSQGSPPLSFTPPSQTALLPLSSFSPTSLLSGLLNPIIQQDFHLPDEQFASLKLHKLRQVAVTSGLEALASPWANTRSSYKRSHSCDPVMTRPITLSLTPMVTTSPPVKDKEHPTELQNGVLGLNLTENVISEGIKSSKEPHTQMNCISPCSAGVCAEDGFDSCKSDTPVFLGNTHIGEPWSSLNLPAKELLSSNESNYQSPSHSVKDQDLHTQPVSFLCLPEETAKESPTVQTGKDARSPGASPLKRFNMNSSPEARQSEPEAITGPVLSELKSHEGHTQLLLTSPQASAPFTMSKLPDATPNTSFVLPSLGLSPHVGPPCCTVASPHSIPSLSLPPPHSPSTQDLSPPALSPSPSIKYTSPKLHPPSLTDQISGSSALTGRHVPLELAPSLRPKSLPLQDTGSEIGLRGKDVKINHFRMRTTTLKAAAGGLLVDACCLQDPSGSLCVAAAGKWAVCLWSQDSASEWSLAHTWTFDDPVINVFPVPDAAGLMCVTLGQLEIRAVRTLCCSTLKQALLCEGVTQAAVGVSESRVVTSAPSATGSTLRVFALSDMSSPLTSRPLVSPGVCVGALAAVDGLPQALLGTDENGHLFVWDLRSGQLLRQITLGDDLRLTACLRGFSRCGALFVLLQHHFLSSLEEEESDVERRNALFSLVAVNPLTGKSVVARHLLKPKLWSGRLCDADVNCNSVVGLSQSGSVCVWELEHREAEHVLWTPEGEGWQLARWGGEDVLMTGQQNGDITLHHDCQTSPLH